MVQDVEASEDASAASVSSIRSKALQRLSCRLPRPRVTAWCSARPLKKETIQQLMQEAVLRVLHGYWADLLPTPLTQVCLGSQRRGA